MEKNLKIIVIIGVVIILVFVGLIIDLMLQNKKSDSQQEGQETVQQSEYSTDDYVISQSINVYSDPDAVLGEGSRVFAVLESIDIENDEVAALNVLDRRGNSYKLSISDMSLISCVYNGTDEVNLVYKTGGSARAIIGSYLYIYKTEQGTWSLDERVQYGGTIEKATGTITGFEFATMTQQQGHLYLSYVILTDASGQTMKFPLITMSVQSMLANGNMTVYFDGESGGSPLYKVSAGDAIKIDVTLTDGTVMTFEVGGQMNLQRSSKKGYWELEKTVDTTRRMATLNDVVFSHDDSNVTGIDYLVLLLEDGTQENMTVLYTQAAAGAPFGNYKRMYTYDGTNPVISDVDPAEDWRMELYYENGAEIELKIGYILWVYKNSDGVYVLDYEYTYSYQQSQKES